MYCHTNNATLIRETLLNTDAKNLKYAHLNLRKFEDCMTLNYKPLSVLKTGFQKINNLGILILFILEIITL